MLQNASVRSGIRVASWGLLALLFSTGCNSGGGGGTNPAPATVSVTISPTTSSLNENGTKTFAASVQSDSNNAGVTWSIGTGVGALSAKSTTGVTYTAPAVISGAATVTLTATSVTDASKSASASITLSAPVITVAVSPANPTVTTGATQQFSAAVTGATDPSVTWSVNGTTGGSASAGTITTAGLYTAPAVVPSPNTVDVTATSVADTSASNSTTVTINGTIESSSQNITAAGGGTITLPSGSSVTIPAGAFAADTNVTLSLLNVMPAQPPTGYLIGAGDALVLTTTAPPFTTLTGNLTFVIASGSNTTGLAGSSGLTDLIDATGDNFFGVPGTFNSNTNLATVTIAAPLMNATSSVVVSMGNLLGPYTAAAAASAPAEPALTTHPDSAAPTPGPKDWDGSGWIPHTACSKVPAGTRILVLVHGMTSSVEDAYGNNGDKVTIGTTPPDTDYCVNEIMKQNSTNSTAYSQAVGFDYDWTQSIDQSQAPPPGSGAQLAGFLNELGNCGYSIDIEAHSEGGPVAASAIMQADAATQALIDNFVGLGNPWDGTPTASGGTALHGILPFTTVLGNPFLSTISGVAQIVPFLQGRTVQQVLNSPFMPQLEPGSSTLSGIQQNLGANMPNLKMTLACGTQPSGIQLRVTEAMGQIFSDADSGFPANDGIIGLSSCQGAGPSGTGNIFNNVTPNLLPPYPLGHTELACDPAVIQAVGQAVQIGSKGPTLLVSPPNIPFGSYAQNYSGPLPNQDLSIASSGVPLQWTAATAGGGWFNIDAGSGTTPSTIRVSATLGAPGTYSGTVTITSAGSSNGSVSIPVTLVVTAVTVDLQLSTAGTGTGTVSPSPAGTSCGTGCYAYNSGTAVQVTASAAAGSTFTGWSGACSGTGACIVTMSSSRSVTATFQPAVSGGSLTGTWSGPMVESISGCGYTGTMSWTLTQTGTALAGSYAYTGTYTSGDLSLCGATTSYSDTVAGSVTGTAITLGGASYAEVLTGTESGTTIQNGVMTALGGTWTFTLTKQ